MVTKKTFTMDDNVILQTLRSTSWNTKKFWSTVDRLTYDQKAEIVRSVGGSKIVKQKYRSKVRFSTRSNLSVGLSVMDYAVLLYAAGIVAEDVSNKGYHLARVLDKGNYDRKNCRFLTYKENLEERQVSEAMRGSAEINRPLALKKLKDLKESDPRRYRDLSTRGVRAANSTLAKMKHVDPKRYYELKRIGPDAMLARKADMKTSDPESYIDMCRKISQAQERRAAARDQKILPKRWSARKKARVRVGVNGWKPRLAEELGVTLRHLSGILRRNPEVEGCLS